VLLVAVLLQQVAEIPGAVPDVELGVVEILDPELRPARMDGDSLGRVREELHQTDRAGGRPGVRLELRLLVDDRGQERRVEVVVARVATNDLLVGQWIPQPLPPARLGRLQRGERCDQRPDEHDHAEDPFHGTRSAITPATNASSSSTVPSLTYA